MRIKIKTEKNDEERYINLNRIRQQSIDPCFLWEGNVNGTWLKIYESETGSVDKIEKDSDILTPADEIICQFNDRKAEIGEIESSGIEHTDESETEDEPYPYDPELIRVDPKPYQVNLVNELIDEGDIDLAPDFQRHFVWKDIGQRSRLIESMMLRIPLPVFGSFSF